MLSKLDSSQILSFGKELKHGNYFSSQDFSLTVDIKRCSSSCSPDSSEFSKGLMVVIAK